MSAINHPISRSKVNLYCTHCGDECPDIDENESKVYFCCNGCEQIYNLLQDNGLGQYYNIENNPGISLKNSNSKSFDYLETPEIIETLIDFASEKYSSIHFSLPAIHCSSCIWLLENLHLLNPGIIKSKVNFLEKKAYISFNHDLISLRQLVELLYKIGYEPELSFSDLEGVEKPKIDRKLLLKIGVAGFSFGNIMLLSFPEYLGFKEASIHFYIGYFNLLLALPVLLYSASSYLSSALDSLKLRKLGIHVPIAIGILTLFLRSAYEIISQTGEGYLDSFAGFVMFLLIGQWFQQRTFKSISFDRNYKNYFPISVMVNQNGFKNSTSIDKIEKGNLIYIRNGEIIPCDGILEKGIGRIDYSFVTGESENIKVDIGQKIYAGGKHTGGEIEIKVEKKVDQSYLTQLWNEKTFKKDQLSSANILLNKISKYFTLTILAIALATFLYWYFIDVSIAFNSITAVLIVACPCALALAIPFIFGNASRILAQMKFYVRSIDIFENIHDVDTIVFDKTGTITSNNMGVEFVGPPLSEYQKSFIHKLAGNSNHPFSHTIAMHLSEFSNEKLDSFSEKIGFGIEGKKGNDICRLGSELFILGTTEGNNSKHVLVEFNGKVIGHFEFQIELRRGIKSTLSSLSQYSLALLSGDNKKSEKQMKEIFPNGSVLQFKQDPSQKLEFISNLQSKGQNVMMIGDGLNDAGAISQSEVGIIVVDEKNNFNPACDIVASESSFKNLSSILKYIGDLRIALYGAFIIAFLYNLIGLGFAVSGNLSPMIAAILMPTSSISIMIYGLLTSKFLARKIPYIHEQEKQS